MDHKATVACWQNILSEFFHTTNKAFTHSAWCISLTKGVHPALSFRLGSAPWSSSSLTASTSPCRIQREQQTWGQNCRPVNATLQTQQLIPVYQSPGVYQSHSAMGHWLPCLGSRGGLRLCLQGLLQDSLFSTVWNITVWSSEEYVQLRGKPPKGREDNESSRFFSDAFWKKLKEVWSYPN